MAKFPQALKAVRKYDYIEDLQKRLAEIRSQLGAHILTQLSEQQSGVAATINGFVEDNRRLEMERTDQLLRMKLDIVQSIQKQLGRKDSEAQDMGSVGVKLLDFTQEGVQVRFEQWLLLSLRFPSIEVRKARIPKAHARTFEWIFADVQSSTRSPVDFMSWLQLKSGTYWISDKAGSGKSSLMKFLASHAKPQAALLAWAGQEDLLVCEYYFWNSGTLLQKSQEGLIRSLLFEILRKNPHLIQRVVPSWWVDFRFSSGTPSTWSLTELTGAFKELLQQEISTKFCFFIDGLDEFYGNPADLVQLLESTINTSPSMKVSVSSRPWNLFEDAFGSCPERKLSLQELTCEDITLYVRDKLEANRHFQQLASLSPCYQNLIMELVGKAQGVFLWVYLVVRDLVQGLTNFDTMSDLQRRLRRLPSNLADYFKEMLESIEDIYLERNAQYFRICLQADEPLPLDVFWIVDEDDADLAIQSATEPWPLHLRESRWSVRRKRLNARTKGLLEVVEQQYPRHRLFNQYMVDFLHRTVRNFLETPEMQLYLESRVAEEVIASAGSALLARMQDTRSEYSAKILQFAVCIGLCTYVSTILSAQQNQTRKPLLHYALLPGKRNADIFLPNSSLVSSRFKSSGHRWSLPMVSLLLDLGESPNQVHDGTTIWNHFLSFVLANWESENDIVKSAWRSIAKKLVQRGADSNSQSTMKDKSFKPFDVLLLLSSEEGAITLSRNYSSLVMNKKKGAKEMKEDTNRVSIECTLEATIIHARPQAPSNSASSIPSLEPRIAQKAQVESTTKSKGRSSTLFR